MKPGDLVQLRWVNNPGDLLYKIPDQLGICVDPRVITCDNHYGSYKGIKFLNPDGTTTVYPVDRWSFEVVQNPEG